MGDSLDASTKPSEGVTDSGPGPPDTDGVADADAVGDGHSPPYGNIADAGGEDGAAAWSCDGDYAFGASSSLVFIDPTPTALASALTEINGEAHPISLVLHLTDGALNGALSATTSGSSGQQTFLPGDVPPLAPVVAAFGSPPGVTTVDPQPNATFRFEDQAGPVDIQLEHVVWRATQGSSCADMTVSLQAVLPKSQSPIVLHLATGEQTIEELSGPSSSDSQPSVTPIGGPPPTPIQVEIAATFKGVPVDFDFNSL